MSKSTHTAQVIDISTLNHMEPGIGNSNMISQSSLNKVMPKMPHINNMPNLRLHTVKTYQYIAQLAKYIK